MRFHVAYQLIRDPATPVPPQIGKLVRLLLLIQAAFCAAVGSVEASIAACFLVLLWPVILWSGAAWLGVAIANHDRGVPLAGVLMVALLVFWMIRVRLTGWSRRNAIKGVAHVAA